MVETVEQTSVAEIMTGTSLEGIVAGTFVSVAETVTGKTAGGIFLRLIYLTVLFRNKKILLRWSI